MAISKANFNSFNVTPTASKFITFNASNNGLAADDIGGNLKLISTQTASSSANLSFTTGIDSTYKEYIFKFINIHPATDNADFEFNGSTDGGSNYNAIKTTTLFRALNKEDNSLSTLLYAAGEDLAQGTGTQSITGNIGNQDDECSSGMLHLFDPSNTTFVKHFISNTCDLNGSELIRNNYVAGYFNTTSAIDAVQFSFTSGNIDSGVIKMYGVL